MMIKQFKDVKINLVLCRLNPYSNGMMIKRTSNVGGVHLDCLNPYSNGMMIKHT